MEGIKINEIDFDNHINKCRMCFKSFSIEEHRIEITKAIEKKFADITLTNLKLTKDTSRVICVICSYQLSTISQAKKNMILAQKSLQSHLRKVAKPQKKSPEKSTEMNFIELIGSEVYLPDDSEIIEEHLDDEQFVTEIIIGPEDMKIKCEHCDVCVNDMQQMKQHVDRVHLNVKNNFCDICGYGAFKKCNLVAHMSSHIDPDERRIHNCDECDFIAISKDSLRNHKSTIHTPKSHTCSICIEIFDTYSQLYQHRLKAHPSDTKATKFSCHDCGKSFCGGGSLANHIAIYHTATAVELPCSVVGCEKRFKTRKQLSQHMKTHNEDKQVCPECGLLVGNKHNLTKHIKRLHLKIYNFYCDLCDYKGFFKFNIDQHMKKHLDKSERERFYCDECHFESISKMSLRTHKRMEHLGQKRTYVCHCGKTFTQSSSYYTHVRVVHQKIKNHACTFAECNKTFAEKSQLRNHVKSQHLKTRDLPCPECGKFFSTQKHLSAHLKYHRPPTYACEYGNCGNAFYTASQLTSHYKVHNNQRDHACHYCEKRYFHRSHLKKHLATHTAMVLR